MTPPDLSRAQWKKSSRSSANGQCVEVANLGHTVVVVRDSKNPTGPALGFDRIAWAPFLTGAKKGEFNQT